MTATHGQRHQIGWRRNPDTPITHKLVAQIMGHKEFLLAQPSEQGVPIFQEFTHGILSAFSRFRSSRAEQ